MRLSLFRITPAGVPTICRGWAAALDEDSHWNAPGHPVLYFGTRASVTPLEMVHYLTTPRQGPRGFLMMM